MHVLFDLDGTLTDSAPGITRCLAHAIESVGARPPTLDALRGHIGTPLVEIFEELIPDPTPGRIDEARLAYIERFDRAGLFENSVFPGIEEALRTLHAEGFTLYIATAKGADTARLVLEQFGLASWFTAVFGADFEAGIRSKQAILARGLAAAGIPASEATMVGDRHHDIEAAIALGVRAVGVGWGYGTEEELSRAHRVAREPTELVEAIVRVRGA